MAPTTSHKRSSDPPPPHALLLEDAKGLSVFWSGTESVAKLVWRLTPSDTHKLESMSVAEVLEKFAAQDYVRNCVVTLIVSPTDKITRPCRMSDNFSSLWADTGRSQTVKLVLDATRGEIPREISSKYLLILSEMSKKRVFWDGRRPVSNLIFRVDEPQMLTTVDTTLRKFMALDYLRSRKLKLELVVAKREESKMSAVHGDDILGSLFTGTSASLRVTMRSTYTTRHPHTQSRPRPRSSHHSSASKEEVATAVTEVTSVVSKHVDIEDEPRSNHSLEKFWLAGNWHEIRERVQYQLEALESLRREREIPPEYEEALSQEKQMLESSLRRRSRSVEEVWRHYEQLKSRVESGLGSFPYRMEVTAAAAAISELDSPVRHSHPHPHPPHPPTMTTSRVTTNFLEEPAPPSDSTEALRHRLEMGQNTTSCIDVVASTLRSLGVEILDEDQRITPAAGVAFTVALVVAICVLSHCVT